MRNWKEIGEVPDSDDESSDSPESVSKVQHQQLVDSKHGDIQKELEQPPDGAISEAKHNNIWDIPSSTEEHNRHALPPETQSDKPATAKPATVNSDPDEIWDVPPSLDKNDGTSGQQTFRTTPPPADYDGPPFSPLSPPPLDFDFENDEFDELGILPSAPAAVEVRDSRNGRDGAGSVAKPPVTFEEDEISTPYVTLTAPLPGRSVSIQNPDRQASMSTTPASNRTGTSSLIIPLASNAGRTSGLDWAEAPTRGRRSLRPRKPIQQHPYLLESVQYAHVMKSHGVKPVRVLTAEVSNVRRTEGGDAPDREFEEDTSQDRVDNRRVEVTDESQSFLFDEMDDDGRDELALSPSPPRTSPRDMLQTSSQMSEGDRTDNTSVLEDDFPSIEELVRHPHKTKSRTLKRHLSSKLLPHSKRPNRIHIPRAIPSSPPASLQEDVWMLPPSSPAVGGFFAPSQDLGSTHRFPPARQTEIPAPVAVPPRNGSSSSRLRPPVVDLTKGKVDDESSGSEASSTASSSKSGSEVIRRNGKRIHGVLPASWLRIDQQKNPALQHKSRRTPDPEPEAAPSRRGVAIRKVSSPNNPAANFTPFFSDDSDDDDAAKERPMPTRRESSLEDSPLAIWSDHDDAGSVVEEDVIDRMFVGTKRNRYSIETSSTAKRRKTTHKNPFKGQTGVKTHQPRITDVLGRTSSKASTGAKEKRNETRKPSHIKKPPRRALTPPRLSVLDVVESNAPPFLKVAARTAKKRQDLGKASPTQKHITLSTRKDNVDALSVLRDWKSGRIRSKTSKAQNKMTLRRKPLQNLSTNRLSPTMSRVSVHAQQHNDQGVDMISFGDIAVEALQKSRIDPKKAKPAARARGWSAHPAQLETEENERPDSVGFYARKRVLDAVFRKSRKASSTSSVRLEQQWDSIRMANGEDEQSLERPANNNPQPQTTSPRQNVKSRFRKRVLPKAIDLQAAHYLHVDDPLPPEDIEVDEPQEVRPQDKLYGLAPYGTKYTYHFEVFPLDRGVYFHSSTIVGSGWITKIIDPLYPERTQQIRSRAFFSMDDKHLRWGPWDDTASSELGILIDWAAEQLMSQQIFEGDVPKAKPQEAAAFLLTYIVDSISFLGEDSAKSFVSRTIEVVDGFLNRIDEARATPSRSTKPTEDLVECLTYLTLVMQAVQRISYLDISLRFQAETLLTKTAKSCIKSLRAAGLEELRSLYGELQRLTARERGIRSGCIMANAWVVLMRVLEHARIPRASFWDVTQAVMMGTDAVSGSDARIFENLWLDMFTLLPLSEVDDFGVVKSGMRHNTPVEGWALPQQLLKRVFSLYMSHTRQPPSFNEYCRALAARCHYLVQEWGWRKCAGIVGTWFDFFGSQNLSHLRNEEVYKSPRFLENLDGNPSLGIDPEDRCFHIFLKILAIVIRRLKKLDLTNDIKNLVARTLPNHNRQYLKEDTVHQRDLAALRNHHDLLCTLFWAAPPDLRPAIHLIEKLVVPGSSHKEACLINMRAWSQLARFIVSSGEGSAAFKPFVAWQTNIFQQVLDQYVSAASDIQQQVLALPKGGPRVEADIVDSMVKQNRAVAMDMLFISVKASFDVLKLAGTLSVATYALNIYQLQQVFTRFDFASPDFDWSIVSIAIEMLEHYVTRVEGAAELEYSSDMAEMTDPQDLEEATLLLDHKIAEKLFYLGRTMLELPAADHGHPSELVRCIEKTVKLSARVACRFINSGFTRTAKYFTPGKYGLFRESPLQLASPQRKFLPLFVATFIKNHVYDFKDVGATLFQLWMVSIVKPYRALAYENYLADILKQRHLPYVQEVSVFPGIAPDYLSNFDLFAGGISYMRKALREADSTHSRQLRDEYTNTLQTVMQKMKEDLAALRPDPVEHRQFMDFVRRIIALLKSHGVGICVIDSFFTQPTADYSPPMEDPQLHTAGIIAYGVRLGEGDSMAVSQLFYYLFNNFKISLINDKLDEEVKILENAMSNDHVFSFVLSRALPAIIWATSKVYEAWPLFDVYLAAVKSLLTRSILSKEVGEDNLVHISALLSNILTWFRTLRDTSDIGLTRIQLHIMTQLMELAAIFQPSLMAYLYSQSGTVDLELQTSYMSVGCFAEEANDYLEEIIYERIRSYGYSPATDVARLDNMTYSEALGSIRVTSLCRGIPDFDWGPVFQSGRELDPQVDSFANEIVRDVRKNWLIGANSISLNAPARGSSMSSTQTGPGTRYELLELDKLFGKLRDRLQCWTHGGVERRPGKRRRREHRIRVVDELFF